MQSRKEWYFVSKLECHEALGSGDWFEVQVLDDDGKAIAVSRFPATAVEVVVDGKKIPLPVLEAAKRRTEGDGDYVGADGHSVPPF